MLTTDVLDRFDSIPDSPPEPCRADILRGLRASNLLAPETVDFIERATRDGHYDLARILLDEELLTPYQLSRILEGKPENLVLGPYRILDQLGGGGFGQVYKASHSLMGRVVALKTMTSAYSQCDAVRDVFYREIAAVIRLSHPNVAATYDALEVGDTLLMAMEFVAGPTLEAFVRTKGPPPIPTASVVMLQSAIALQHAHENGVIHRDIKPENILAPGLAGTPGPIDPSSPVVKLIDFGLSRLHQRDNRPVGTFFAAAGAIVGTPACISPEQAVNFHDADARSDLYSLGCTFYYLLTGCLPFKATNVRALIEKHRTQTPTPIRDLWPEVPPGLAAIVHRLMAKNPDDRYQTAEDLATALTEVILSGLYSDGNAPVVKAVPPVPEFREQPVALLTAPPEVVPADVLRRLWLEWCAVIETHAHGRPVRMSESRYALLYRELVRGLHVAHDDPDRTQVWHDPLQTVVEPWVTLNAIRMLDQPAAAALLRTCGELDPFPDTAGNSDGSFRGWPVFQVALLGGFVAGVGWVISNWHWLTNSLQAAWR